MTAGWTKRRLLILFALISIIAIVESRAVLPSTPSVPYHLLLIATGPGAKGDYVNVVVPGAYVGRKEKQLTLTKRIGCVAGDSLRFDGEQHYCNGLALGRVLDRSVHGKLAPFIWNGAVPPGKAYLVGTHIRSYDSRYFGFVDIDRTHKLIPIF